ncbi:MAG: hypothetical protein ABSF51_01710 [Verrucomicrobiota bacterium]|jgi:hypothetical protein
MKNMTVQLVIMLGVGTALSAFSQNLLVNGDFEMGNAGFTSTYAYSPSNLWNEGSYDIVTNPRLDHRLGGSFGDHTTGTGFMLAMNGSRDTNAVVWSETVSVSPDTTYLFSGWSASWGDDGHSFDPSPAMIRVLINGQQYAGDVRSATTNGLWQSFTTVWHSQSSTQAVIEIRDENTEWSGNDFALDDLSFVSLSTQQTSSVVVSSSGSSNSNSNASQQVWSPQPNPLPRDSALGFALPIEVGLTYQIQASPDLIHWVQATNVAFYFRDFDSTNYNERFYRFEKK